MSVASRQPVREFVYVKAAPMAHLTTNAYMKGGAWRYLSHDQRKSAIECGCGAPYQILSPMDKERIIEN